MKKALECIICPMSCQLEIEIDEKGNILQVQGNTCPRGEKFARQEMTCPMRMVTTTIKIEGGIHELLPVITSQNIPKTKIFDIMNICKAMIVDTPILAGSVLVKDIADSGADLIASRTMEKKK